MKKHIITILLTLVAVTAQAQFIESLKKKENPKWVQYDKYLQGYRYIQTELMYVTMPKRSEFWANIGLNYYEGFKQPYYVRIYTGCMLSVKDELILTFSDGREMHLYADESNVMHSNLGLGKKVYIYDAIYQLDEFQLKNLVSSSILGIRVGWGEEWHSKEFKKDKLGKFMSLNYQAIQKRLAKSK